MTPLDIEDQSTNALAMITIVLNETLSKNPNHKFVQYFNEIEKAIRVMRETNIRLLMENKSLNMSISQMGFDETDKQFSELIEKIEPPMKPLTDEEYLKKPLRTKEDKAPF